MKICEEKKKEKRKLEGTDNENYIFKGKRKKKPII